MVGWDIWGGIPNVGMGFQTRGGVPDTGWGFQI